MATPPPNELRQLILKFYSENDPAKLRMGLDVNGIVEWTSRNGMNALNTMLKKQFGKEIDPNSNLGSATQQFMRMSTTLTPGVASTKMPQNVVDQAVEENDTKDQILYKLQKFYEQHDPSKLNDLDKLVTFAMYHGIRKLNTKLVSKYGEGIPEGEVKVPVDFRKENNAPPEAPPRTPGRGPPGLPPRVGDAGGPGESEDELRADIIKYYEQVDAEQLDALDAIMDWALMIGRKELDEKLEQIYGISLDHVTRPERVKAAQAEANAAPRKLPTPGPAVNQVPRSPAPTGKKEADVRDFSEMTEKEIRDQLALFYKKHDEDTIEKLDQIYNLALKLGRAEMNEKLYDIYNETLDDVVHEEFVKNQQRGLASQQPVEQMHIQTEQQYEQPRQSQKQKKGGLFGKLKKALPTPKLPKVGSFVESSVSNTNGSYYTATDYDSGNQSRMYNSPPQLPPGPGMLAQDREAQTRYRNSAKRAPPPPEIETANEIKSNIAKMAMEFKNRENSRFDKFENLEDACDNYEIDMLGENMGACKNCGFPRMQHKNRKQRVLEIRNSKGLPNVREMIKARNAFAQENRAAPLLFKKNSYGSFTSATSTPKFRAPAPKPITQQRSKQKPQQKPQPMPFSTNTGRRKDPKGPCRTFQLDMLAPTDATCVNCGYNRAAHSSDKRKTFKKFFAPIYNEDQEEYDDDDEFDDNYDDQYGEEDEEFDDYYDEDNGY